MITPPKNVKLIDYPTSTMWFDENGILYSVSKKNPSQTVEQAKQSVLELKKLLDNKKVCLLSDTTNSAPTTKEIRDYAAEVLPDIIKAVAIISGSPLGKMIANLFFSIKKQPYPAKFFNDEKKAKEWLMQYL
ncbi:MAG: hypothetical protein A3H98_01630 [Bacteroidetes bacterium RIFCSPLOWO2_02_FULL_36_8]|nr:MAG: hypothetical protein A3H98_01630 [Bacteroidetes bacterium RIFCSPLOWO2_02_FULL_36_8]OFY69358.1 MAG: hypothetical protein A3G23_00975 [Bacteroidetes bacterium RIFCSPLOWO2_12_FULL_37_12]